MSTLPFQMLGQPRTYQQDEGVSTPNPNVGMLPLDIGMRQEDIGRSPGSLEAEIGLRKVAEGSNVTGAQRFLAMAAALSGNFGPAIALQEQQRKAQMAMQLFPVMNSIGKLETSGKHDEAAEALTNALTVAESKAPGLVPPLQAKLEQINKKRQAWNDLNTATAIALKDMPKNHPDRGRWEALAEANKNRSAMSSEMVKEILPLLRPHIQTIEGGTRYAGQLGGVQSIPLEAIFDDNVLKGYVGQEMNKLTGLRPDQLTALFRGYPTVITDGKGGTQVIQPTPQNMSRLNQALAQIQGQQAGLTVGQSINIPPDVQAQQAKLGVPPLNIAQRTVPEGWTPQQTFGIPIEEWQARLKDVAAFPTRVAIEESPTALKQAGIIGVDMSDANFGMYKTGLTWREIRDSKGMIVPMGEDIHKETITPLLNTYSALNKVAKLWETFGNPSSVWDTVDVGLTRRISNLIGIPLNENVTIGTALELQASQAIEALEKTGAIKSGEAGRLKDFTLRGFASPDGALKAIAELQDRAKDKLSLYIEKNKLDSATGLQRLQAISGGQQSSNVPDEQLYRAFNVTPALANVLLTLEDSKQGDVSFMGAASRWQITPDTAKPYLKDMGYNVDAMKNEAIQTLLNSDKRVADTVGLTHIAKLESKYPGRPDLVMAEYHGGAGAVLPNGTVNPASKEPDRPGKPGLYTTEYVKRGMTKLGIEKTTGKVVPVRKRKDLVADPTGAQQ